MTSPPTAVAAPKLQAFGIGKEYQVAGGRLFGPRPRIVAVEDVSIAIATGSTFGLIGESGSGKSTFAKLVLKLEKPSSGQLSFDGRDIFQQTKAEEREYRRRVQAVLQDPYGALSPRMRVGNIVAEPLRAQGVSKKAAAETAAHMLERVGLSPDMAARFPHQFSGGQRQRIAIARAMSVDPEFLVLDEPVSALDVSVRAQVLTILRDMQAKLGLTYMFIGHDLAVVKFMSDTVGVMYFGRIVEYGDAATLFRRAAHPYTRRLISIASMQAPLGESVLKGELPNPLAPPSGCAFHTRCPLADKNCIEHRPPLRDLGNGHLAACHYAEGVQNDNLDIPIRSSTAAPNLTTERQPL